MSRNAGSPHVERPVVEHYEDRFTVDLDAKPGVDLEMQATQTWHYLLDVADGVDVHVSSSGWGLHFVAYLKESLTFAEKIRHRRTAGDDPRRIDMEIQRWQNGLRVDVLFQQKDVPQEHGSVKNKERRYPDVYAALDAIQARRDDRKRVKKVAQRGHKGDPEMARRAES